MKLSQVIRYQFSEFTTLKIFVSVYSKTSWLLG